MNVITIRLKGDVLNELGFAEIMEITESIESLWVGRTFDGAYVEVDRLRFKPGIGEEVARVMAGEDIDNPCLESPSIMKGLHAMTESGMDMEVLDLEGDEMIIHGSFNSPHEMTNPFLDILEPFLHKHFIIDRFWYEDGNLYFSLFGPQKSIRSILEDLRKAGVDHELISSHRLIDAKKTIHPRVTASQELVLRTARDMGYFREPHGCTVRDIGARLSIDPSTVAEHLRKATSRLVEAYVGG